MLKITISLFITLIFVGCSTTQQNRVIYEKYKAPQKTLHVKEKIINDNVQAKVNKTKVHQIKALDGVIKGNVTNLIYIDGFWIYKVKGTDTSNNKLSQAEFKSKEKVAKEGDFVYAIIKDGSLKEFYLIKKANYKKKKIVKTYKKIKQQKTVLHKRTKKRQVLGVPTSEEISFD